MKIKAFAVISFVCYTMLYNNIAEGQVKKRKIKKIFKHSHILNDHFTGFALYDLDKHKMIYDLNADKYYTPASNTKLFTFYTCLKMLGDSVPALRYVVHNDSLIFWGTGDPSFLHEELKGINGYNFLSSSNKKLFFAAGNYTGNFFGDGWAWNDYNADYQAQISELPIMGNLVKIYADSNNLLQTIPRYFKWRMQWAGNKPGGFNVTRNFSDNTFVYSQNTPPSGFSQYVPWKTGTDVTLDILQDTLKKPVNAIRVAFDSTARTIYNVKADSVYKYMLQQSDNFMAEQLLLACSSVKFGVLNTDSVIRYSKSHLLADLPDEPKWVDGSGLSRYNMFTPRSIVALLIKLLEVKDEQLLHSLLPQGGVAGTLKKSYKTDNGQVFVWAKTGSLMYDYNQSGYLVTRKGKRLAFSFMNNNFTDPPREVRDEMVRIITYIHNNY